MEANRKRTLALLFCSLLCGCNQSEEGFRTFNSSDEVARAEPAPTPETSEANDSQPSSEVNAETTPVPTTTVSSSPVLEKADSPPAASPAVAADNPMPSAVSPAAATQPEAAAAIAPTPPAPPAAEAIQQVAAALPVRKIELLVPEKNFKVVGPENAVRVSFDDLDLLKVLNADPVPVNIEDYMPHWLSALTGTRVRIRGFMYPPNSETDLPAFMMVRDSKDCCFGRNVLIYDKIGVRMREGVTTDYIQLRPFDVVGVMTVKARISDGKLVFLYMIDDAVVIEG